MGAAARHLRAGLLAASFLLVAAVQSWPLPRHLDTHLTGPPGGDTGVYVWNTWVFRHELLEGRSPFSTSMIFALDDGADLSLHNYTAFADLIAVPLQPALGVVRTFNLIYLLNVALAGWGMFLLARRMTGRSAEAWLAGLLFACSPFMVTRGGEHFSLVAAAPLPIFVWLLQRAWASFRVRDAAAVGAVAAWAAFCDPYYAVYCGMLGAAFLGSRAFGLSRRRAVSGAGRRVARVAVDTLAVVLAGAMLLVHGAGHGSVRVGSWLITMHTLYTPMLLLTAVAVVRVWLTARPRLSRRSLPSPARLARWLTASVVAAAILLSPVLYAVARRAVTGTLVSAPVNWRSSAPGVDLLGLVVPNPNHPLMPQAVRDWFAAQPNGYADQIASVSYVALIVIAAAWIVARFRPGWRWPAVAGGFAVLALGPFVRVAGVNTFVPTPWILLRYLPIVGAARMPGRLAVVAMLGLAAVFALALSALTHRFARHRRLLLAGVGVALAAELVPVPRPLYSAGIPGIYATIAADPRPIRVLELPFGVRDGLSSLGDFTAASQFHQTLHGKPLVGGYLSRVSNRHKLSSQRRPVLGALLTLSERRPLSDRARDRAQRGAASFLSNAQIGYVVVDTSRASPALRSFAVDALGLVQIGESGKYQLFRPRQ